MITSEERERYDRQIKIEGWGIEGQQRLKQAKVLIAGAGGLGSAISVYLGVAGVGSLRIIDRDMVNLSNLNRQILHCAQDIGREKVQSASETLRKLNPAIQIEAIAETITQDNAFLLSEGCNLILDAMDNFPARYALNKAAIQRGIPFLYGGIYGIEGMTTTIIPKETACLRCIFPEPPPTTVSPASGVAAGVIGCLQALEAIKYIVGIGELLTNRLLIFDGLSSKFREVRLTRRSQCPDCSPEVGDNTDI